MPILQLLAGILTGKAGEQIGGAVSVAAQVAALVAALAPIALWLGGHKDDVFITLTYGDLAFWGFLIAAQVFLVVRLVHRAAPPA
ncbi:MAG: hypothetical protein EG825_10255 [Rhodocyclaceae bacterium]|nr:hypothetical protein [Rhodocyclaceae bacterium]